ncbi:MAG: hypothetical protein AB1646_14050 [Thermodesulfobacteriota bacterium]
MTGSRRLLEKVPFLANGHVLVGSAFAVAGLVTIRAGVSGLWGLWNRLEAYRPFTIPDDAPQMILVSLPLILKVFVIFVSSVSAVLIGTLWFGSGVMDAVGGRRRANPDADLAQRELVAESIRTNSVRGWSSEPLLLKIGCMAWGKAREMTPAVYQVFAELVRSLLGLLFWVAVIWLIGTLLGNIQYAVKQVLNKDIVLVVPAMRPLYLLVGLMAAGYALAALSLLPIGRRQTQSTGRRIVVKGRGNPFLFFALIEEGCRLLVPKDSAARLPARFQDTTDPHVRSSLVESPPTPDLCFAKPAAYVCVPLFLVLVWHGFSSIVGFDKPEIQMPYHEFLSRHLLDYVFSVVFAFGLVMCGLSFAELAGRFFGISRFRSAVIFCRARPVGIEDTESAEIQASAGSGLGNRWQSAEGGDEQFSSWVKDAGSGTRFEIEIWWAEALSESESPGEDRHLLSLLRSESLDGSMSRIIQIPFRVGFEADQSSDRTKTPLKPEQDESKRPSTDTDLRTVKQDFGKTPA